MATTVTVLPDIVQTPVVVDVNVMARLEVSVAVMLNGATPRLTFGSAPKVIVCDALLTVKLWVTEGAAE